MASMTLGVSLLQNTVKDGFFKLKGLSTSAVARLEKAVKTSRDTLALADKLEAARDIGKSLHDLEMSIKDARKKAAAKRGGVFDLFS